MGKGSAAKARRGLTGARGRASAAAGESREDSPEAPEVEFAQPLRPRPRLLAVLSTVLALWVAFLLVLYFRTVYPERKADHPRTAAPLGSESAPPAER